MWGHIPSYSPSLVTDDHVNNHLFIGDHPRPQSTLRCVKSRPSLANQKGIEPSPQSTLHCVKSGSPSQIRRYRALQHSQHSAMPSRGLALAPDQHSIGSFRDVSSPLVPTSVPIASHVPLLTSPSSLWPVTDPIAPMVSSVTSPRCHASLVTMSSPLKTTQATSHEQPVDTPSDPNVRDLLSLKKSTMRCLCHTLGPELIGTIRSSMSTTLIPSTNPSLLSTPSMLHGQPP